MPSSGFEDEDVRMVDEESEDSEVLDRDSNDEEEGEDDEDFVAGSSEEEEEEGSEEDAMEDDEVEEGEEEEEEEEEDNEDDLTCLTQEEKLERKDTNVKALLAGTLAVRRRPIISALSVKGAETLSFRSQFKPPRIVNKAQFSSLDRRKVPRRPQLGMRSRRMVFRVPTGSIPARFTPPTDEESEEEEDSGAEELPTEPEPPAPLRKAKKKPEDIPPEDFEPVILFDDGQERIEVEYFLAKVLRPHQREGVQFVTECLLSQRGFDGAGAILADDMGLGKTLQSVTILYTFLTQGLARRCIVVCPTSLIGNWKNEVEKWTGDRLKCVALSESGKDAVGAGIQEFRETRGRVILIISYDTFRLHERKITGLTKAQLRKQEELRRQKALGDPEDTDDSEDSISDEMTSPPPEAAEVNGMSSPRTEKQVTLAELREPEDPMGYCDLLIVDESQRLKNQATATYQSLDRLNCRRRVLLTGTPLQNHLTEFYSLARFANRNCLGGSLRRFQKHYENPIVAGREPTATDEERELAQQRAMEMSHEVNRFILRRSNALLSKHLPPKVIHVVCCGLAPLQRQLYEALCQNKSIRDLFKSQQRAQWEEQQRKIEEHKRLLKLQQQELEKQQQQQQQKEMMEQEKNGGAVSSTPSPDTTPVSIPNTSGAGVKTEGTDTAVDQSFWLQTLEPPEQTVEKPTSKSQVLPLINSLRALCNHPKLLWDAHRSKMERDGLSNSTPRPNQRRTSRRNAATRVNFAESPRRKRGSSGGGRGGAEDLDEIWTPELENLLTQEFRADPEHPRWSGKMDTLDRLLCSVRRRTNDRVVLVSNFTQTLDLMQKLCELRGWKYVRLDGSISAGKRSQLVERFEDPKGGYFAFLLSSTAGGCGLNLVGANRLVLYESAWNPSTDLQAAARVWRDGQDRRCFIYRMLSSGTIEEKIFQRQLAKEGLKGVIMHGEPETVDVSQDELRDLFRYSPAARSDTHEGLGCRCVTDHLLPLHRAKQQLDAEKMKKKKKKEEEKGEESTQRKEDGMERTKTEGSTVNDSGDHCLEEVSGYLGQVDWPSETDLKLWSHHPNPLTTPDPAFRAACAPNFRNPVGVAPGMSLLRTPKPSVGGVGGGVGKKGGIGGGIGRGGIGRRRRPALMRPRQITPGSGGGGGGGGGLGRFSRRPLKLGHKKTGSTAEGKDGKEGPALEEEPRKHHVRFVFSLEVRGRDIEELDQPSCLGRDWFPEECEDLEAPDSESEEEEEEEEEGQEEDDDGLGSEGSQGITVKSEHGGGVVVKQEQKRRTIKQETKKKTEKKRKTPRKRGSSEESSENSGEEEEISDGNDRPSKKFRSDDSADDDASSSMVMDEEDDHPHHPNFDTSSEENIFLTPSSSSTSGNPVHNHHHHHHHHHHSMLSSSSSSFFPSPITPGNPGTPVVTPRTPDIMKTVTSSSSNSSLSSSSSVLSLSENLNPNLVSLNGNPKTRTRKSVKLSASEATAKMMKRQKSILMYGDDSELSDGFYSSDSDDALSDD